MRTGVRPVLGAAVVAASFGVAACALVRTPIDPDSLAGDPGTLAVAAAVCVGMVNDLRAGVGVPPVTRSAQLDEFSATAARVDGEAHQAHKYFTDTNGGPGIATAETVIPWWRLSDYGSVQTVVRRGIAQMWAEGGTHSLILRAPYAEAGCGVAVIGGEVTVSQNFR